MSRHIAVTVRVRWADCDPAGIVFYPRFFEWMDLAAHALTRAIGVSAEDMLPPTLLGLPVVASQAEFLAPARLEDTLEVRATVTRVGRTSLGLRYEIVRVGDAPMVLVRGREERVHISQDEAGVLRPRELTPEMRAVLASYADPASPERAARS